MAEPTRTRWFQFDLRTLFVLTAIVAAFLAWQFRPQPKPMSEIAKALKVGDRVTVRTGNGEYTILTGDVPTQFSRRYSQFTVEAVTAETVRLKGSTMTSVIRIEKIARVDRYDDQPKDSTATAANAGASAGMGANSQGGLLGSGGMDAGGGGAFAPGTPGRGSSFAQPGAPGFGRTSPSRSGGAEDTASGGETNKPAR